MSLIEMMISCLLFSSLSLTVGMLETRVLRDDLAMQYYLIAEQQVSDLISLLHVSFPHERESMIKRWQAQLTHVLPNSNAHVMANYPHVSVAVTWGGYDIESCKSTAIAPEGCVYAQW